jgi:succinate-semialdehyde dehydrogenase/glutarate-semialdehyde dehydrogenase
VRDFSEFAAIQERRENQMLKKTSHYLREANLIGGEWVQADSGKTIDVTNPATTLKIGTVPKSGKAETRRAIEAAQKAFETWKKTTANERSKLLRKLHDLILENQDALAELLTMEQGKSLAEAKGEVGISAAYVLWFAEEGRRTYGDTVPSPWADRRILVTKEPVGVIAAITPWNFPSSMLARKIGPALAAGCTVVVKPASQTPYSGLAWGAAVRGGRLPEGRRQHRHRFGWRDRRRDLRQPAGPQADLHRLDRNRQAADGEVRRDREEGVDGTRRQRAVHRLRRRRSRQGGRRARWSPSTAIPARPASAPTASSCRKASTTSSSRSSPPRREQAEGRQSGLEPGTQQGPLIDEKAVEKVEEFIADAKKKGGKSRHRRQAPASSAARSSSRPSSPKPSPT